MPQSLANVLIHVVWSTKNREPWINDDIRPRFHAYLIGVLDKVGCPSLEMNSEPDHVHILCALSRTVTIAKMVEQAKISTSLWFKKLDSPIPSFCWQGGYAVFSVSQSQVEGVRSYIKSQREHHGSHRVMSFQDELRAMLKKHGMAFDERYVWD